MVRNVKLIALGILLFLLLFVCVCSEKKEPIELITLHVFYPEHDKSHILIYIDWVNQSKFKKIDCITLEFACNEDYDELFQCYLLEPTGILPSKHNKKKLITLGTGELLDMKIDSMAISISQVNFTDGSIWENKEEVAPLIVEINGEKGVGIFPAKLNEALFFEGYAEPRPIDPIYFQVDWTNISEKEKILSVTYEVTVKTPNGTIISDKNGNDKLFISEYYENALEWINPGLNNKVVTHYIHNYDSNYYVEECREKGGRIFEIAISQVVDSKGVVWENHDQENKIVSVLCGKKSYAFHKDFLTEPIAELINNIADRGEIYGLNMKNPLVYIKKKSYCVLRYEDVDVYVELSDSNEVIPNLVAFVYYSKKQYENKEDYVQSCFDKINALRLCICPIVLHDRPYDELMETLKRYNENPDTYFNYNDLVNGSFGKIIDIMDEHSNVIDCAVIGFGERLNNLPKRLFWIRQNIWTDR